MAVQRQQSSITDLHDELICPICLDLYKIPVILPCSHVLCKSCCEQLIGHSFIRCPVCRERNYISGGLSALPRVRTLENIIARYSGGNEATDDRMEEGAEACEGGDEGGSRGDVKCQLCQGQKKAVKSCQDCNASYCAKCLVISHPDRAPFSDHTLTQPTNTPRPKVTNCCSHEERASVYCLTCHVLCCLLCVELKCHDGHDMVAIADAYNREKELLMESLRRLEMNESISQASILQLQVNQRDLKTYLESGKSRINAECDSLVREIDARRHYFLADLEYEVKEKLNVLDDAENEYRRLAGKSRSLNKYSREVLREQDKAAFLQLAYSVNERVEKSIKESPGGAENTLPPPETSVLSHMKTKVVDFRKERSVLRELNYLSAPCQPELDCRCLRTWNGVLLTLVTPPAAACCSAASGASNVACSSSGTVKCSNGSNGNHTSTVVDVYLVNYAVVDDDTVLSEESIIFKVPEEERKQFITDRDTQTMLLIPYLQMATNYRFTVKAMNAAGESALSSPVYCTTLKSPDTDFPVPNMDPTLSRAFTSSIQIYCLTPSQFSQHEAAYTFHLMYREASVQVAPRIWRVRPMSQHGVLDHRIFGLTSNTQYEFMVLICGDYNVCHMSEPLVLKTGSAAF